MGRLQAIGDRTRARHVRLRRLYGSQTDQRKPRRGTFGVVFGYLKRFIAARKKRAGQPTPFLPVLAEAAVEMPPRALFADGVSRTGDGKLGSAAAGMRRGHGRTNRVDRNRMRSDAAANVIQFFI